MKTNIRYTVLSILCAGLCFFLSCNRKDKADNNRDVPEIDVAEVLIDSVVLHKTYPGYLVSGTAADAVAQVDGKLIYKYYKAGTYVKQGQKLFGIDPTLYQYAVEKAEAALASAISTRDYAKHHYDAVKKAFEAEAVSKMEVLSAESNLEQAEANIKDCRASLKTAQTNLGYCTIVAPVSGMISESYVGEGNYVSGSGAPVKMATIYDSTVVSALFEIEDAQYERMVGRTSGVNDPIYREIPLQFRDKLLHDYTANLCYEAPSVDRNTGTIQLKGDVKNIHNELKPGMYVTVDLPYGINPKAILIKGAAIGTDQLGDYVYVVNDSNKVVYTPIKIGGTFRDSLRIVESGLNPGDKYVTKALLTVRTGETVKPKLTN